METTISAPVTFRLHKILKGRVPPLSQSELSRRSGISATTINAMVLNKTKQVSLSTLDAISKALGIEPGELIERDRGKRK